MDARAISLTAKGTVSVHACNYIGATARVGPAMMAIAPATATGATDLACSGENGEVERLVNAMLAAGTVHGRSAAASSPSPARTGRC